MGILSSVRPPVLRTPLYPATYTAIIDANTSRYEFTRRILKSNETANAPFSYTLVVHGRDLEPFGEFLLPIERRDSRMRPGIEREDEALTSFGFFTPIQVSISSSARFRCCHSNSAF